MTCINLDVNLAIKQQKGKNLSEELTWLETVLVKQELLTRKNNILWSATGFE
jgi:hypothetical protein